MINLVGSGKVVEERDLLGKNELQPELNLFEPNEFVIAGQWTCEI